MVCVKVWLCLHLMNTVHFFNNKRHHVQSQIGREGEVILHMLWWGMVNKRLGTNGGLDVRDNLKNYWINFNLVFVIEVISKILVYITSICRVK